MLQLVQAQPLRPSAEASREGGRAAGATAAKALVERATAPVERASSRAFDTANDAWERGDYVAALTDYIQILSTPGGEKWLDAIALCRFLNKALHV